MLTEPLKPPSALVNIAHPQQDVHRERIHAPTLYRYRIAEQLLPVPATGLSVLELGGGIAELSRRMKVRGVKVTFVDLSEHNIHKAQAAGFKAHQLDLNLGLPVFDDEQFDGVVMLEIIEHVVAAEFLLAEVSRVLKPGGFVILSTPNFAFLLNRLRILSGKLSQDEGYHYRFFTAKALTQRLKAVGLMVEQTAHNMPAFGLNLIRNKIFGRPRAHIRIPKPLSPIFAQTLMVRARKCDRSVVFIERKMG